MTKFKEIPRRALFTLLLALVVGAAVTAIASASTPAPSTTPASTTVYYACVSKFGGILTNVNSTAAPRCGAEGTNISWNQTGPQGPAGTNGTNGTNGSPGPQGPAGTAGTSGTNGTDGTNGAPGAQGPPGSNGSSVVTSSGPPSGACTNGDTDIDLDTSQPDNGAVYTCSASAWVATGSSIEGPQGPAGTGGTGQPPVVDATWTPTFPSSTAAQLPGGSLYTTSVSSTAQVETGSTLKSISATLTGNLSACGYYSVEVIDPDGTELAEWYLVPVPVGGMVTAQPPTSDIGTSDLITTTGSLVAEAGCYGNGSNFGVFLPWPSGVSVSFTMQWTHATPTEAIS